MRFRFPGASVNVWDPLANLPSGANARLYRSDQGVTSAGSATRQRLGTICTTLPEVFSATEGTNVPLDGQGFCELASGRFLIAGGAPQGHANEVVNAIWYSDDRGKTWSTLLADGDHAGWVAGTTPSSSTTRPQPAHSFGFFTLTIAGTEYVYWVGSDPFLPSGNVFRSSDGGTTWSLVSTTCPTSGLALYLVGVLGTDIYVLGGQTSIQDTGVVSSHVYKSTDYGATWTDLGAAPWPGRGAQLGPMPSIGGKLWLVGGAQYHSTDFSKFYNDVWTFDGTTWTQVLADGNSQIPRTRYHSLVALNSRLWKINGTIRVNMTGSPSLTFSGTTITRSAGSFLTDGFVIGMLLQTIGSASNDTNCGITNVTDTVLTVDTARVTEGPTAGVTLYGVRGDTKSLHYSDDGVTWTQYTDPLPWGDTHAQAAIAAADGIFLTNGFQSSQVYRIAEHTGALVSAWADQGSGGLTLSQATDANKPILDLSGFSARPGLAFTLAQFLQLAAPDRGIANGVLEIYAVVKSLNFDASAAQGPNPPCVIVGESDGSTWNNFGLNDGALEYKHQNAGTQTIDRGSGLNVDGLHVLGVVQTASFIRLYIDGVESGADAAGGFDTSFTGWNNIGSGYLNADQGAFVVGAVLILRDHTTPSSDTFRSNLQTWAQGWGA